MNELNWQHLVEQNLDFFSNPVSETQLSMYQQFQELSADWTDQDRAHYRQLLVALQDVDTSYIAALLVASEKTSKTTLLHMIELGQSFHALKQDRDRLRIVSATLWVGFVLVLVLNILIPGKR